MFSQAIWAMNVSTQSLQGDQLGLLVQNLVTIIAGFAIALAYGWRMTLVILAVVPLMMLAGWFQVMRVCMHT